MSRPFLVYCPTDGTEIAAHLFGEGRRFDVALNNYLGESRGMTGAEHQFKTPGHKWPGVHTNLAAMLHTYEAYAFLDNDIEATTDQLNRLFLKGRSHGLRLWQAALSEDSYRSHFRFVAVPGNDIRPSPFVEVMMPVFSQDALKVCFETFGETQSGWGLDLAWPGLLGRGGIAIVDAITFRHGRPVNSDQWVMANGLTPLQELELLRQKYHLLF